MERAPLRLKGSGGALGGGKQKKVKDKPQILEQITSSRKQQQRTAGLDVQPGHRSPLRRCRRSGKWRGS